MHPASLTFTIVARSIARAAQRLRLGAQCDVEPRPASRPAPALQQPAARDDDRIKVVAIEVGQFILMDSLIHGPLVYLLGTVGLRQRRSTRNNVVAQSGIAPRLGGIRRAAVKPVQRAQRVTKQVTKLVVAVA